MLVTGGAIAGLSGGILVSYITTWSPAAWGYAETVVLFAAVIIGGAGQPPRRDARRRSWCRSGSRRSPGFIPTSNSLPPNLIPSLEWVAIGLLIVVFLWFRPQGVLPERKRVIAAAGPPAAAEPVPGTRASRAPSAAARSARAASAVRRGRRTAAGWPPRERRAPGRRMREVVLQATDVVREFGGVRAVTACPWPSGAAR